MALVLMVLYSLRFKSIRKVACALTKPVASIHSLRSSYPQRPSPCPCFFVLYGLLRLPRYRFHPHLSALSSLPIVACASPWTPYPPCHLCLWRQSWRDALWTANLESKPTLHGFMPWVGRKASAGLPNQRNGSSTKLLALNTGAVVVRMVAKTNSTVLIIQCQNPSNTILFMLLLTLTKLAVILVAAVREVMRVWQVRSS